MSRATRIAGLTFFFDKARKLGYAEAMKANLHLHSCLSDGTDWPLDIVARAAGARLKHIALTDHDTLGGVPEFLAAARQFGIRGTAATEIDCSAPDIGYRSEILAYFPDGNYSRSAAFLTEIGHQRINYLKKTLARAAAHFLRPDLTFQALLDQKRYGRSELPEEAFSFSKVDLYRYLRQSQVIPEELGYKAFKKTYLDSRLLADGSYSKPSCGEIIRLIRSDGGVAVLPHPGHEFENSAARMTAEKKRLRDLFGHFKNLGVQGVELYWYRNDDTEAINRLIRREADAISFFCTFGSDCHGPGSGKESLGAFSGNFKGFPVGR